VIVRELRVTDIRCTSCNAGPGELCRFVSSTNPLALAHDSRAHEHAKLVAEGWQWQEVDPRDVGAKAR
jgi:hypothetical protein